MSEKGMSQPEVSLLIQTEMQKYSEQIRALGCGSEVGSMALKKHENYHKDKLDSKIEGFKLFKEQQTEENNKTALKLSKVLDHFNETHALLGENMKELHKEIKQEQSKREADIKEEVTKREKNDDKIWSRIWVFAGVVVLLALTTIWSGNVTVNKVKESVQKVNKVDVDNQKNTEAFLMELLIELKKSNELKAVR